jgi:hypothetical protein
MAELYGAKLVSALDVLYDIDTVASHSIKDFFGKGNSIQASNIRLR